MVPAYMVRVASCVTLMPLVSAPSMVPFPAQSVIVSSWLPSTVSIYRLLGILLPARIVFPFRQSFTSLLIFNSPSIVTSPARQ